MAGFNAMTTASELVNHARKQGAAAAEILILRDSRLELIARDANPEQLNQYQNSLVAARIRTDKGAATGLSSSLERPALRSMIERAISHANKQEGEPAGDHFAPRATPTSVDTFDPDYPSIKLSDKLRLLQEIEREVKVYSPLVERVLVTRYDELLRETTLVSSRGFRGSYPQTLYGESIAVSLKSNANVRISRATSYRRRYRELRPAKSLAEEACLVGLLPLNGKPCLPGEYEVIIDRRQAAPSLIRHALAPALRADWLDQNASYLSGAYRSTIASETLTLIDDPTMAGTAGSAPFDLEGSPSLKRTLIQNGRLRRALDNRATAAANDRQATGTGWRPTPRDEPRPTPRNLYVEAGAHSTDKLISSVKSGVFVVHLRPLAVDARTGLFRFELAGRMIRGGELAEPVNRVFLNVNGSEFWKRIEQTSSELEFHSPDDAGAINSPSLKLSPQRIRPLS